MVISNTVAAVVLPLARLPVTQSLPISWYADKSFYVIRTAANDRFCMRLEERFTRMQSAQMRVLAAFEQICFSNLPPYGCAVGIRPQRGH